jgi:DASS family divalent anion:Na+ symporter
MGPLTTHEKIVLFTLLLMIFLWTVGQAFMGVSATITTFVGLLCLLLSGGLTWSDVTGERAAWDTLIWFAIVLTMAGFLNTLGFIPWFSKHVAEAIGSLSWSVAFVALALVYFYAHYFFASLNSHVAAMYVAFVGTAIAVQVPPILAVMTFGFLSSYFSTLTHYGGAAPTLLFAQGFLDTGEWWRKNFIMSLFNLPIWIGLGAGWLKLLGAW